LSADRDDDTTQTSSSLGQRWLETRLSSLKFFFFLIITKLLQGWRRRHTDLIITKTGVARDVHLEPQVFSIFSYINDFVDYRNDHDDATHFIITTGRSNGARVSSKFFPSNYYYLQTPWVTIRFYMPPQACNSNFFLICQEKTYDDGLDMGDTPGVMTRLETCRISNLVCFFWVQILCLLYKVE
jgi:hypothetical protein